MTAPAGEGNQKVLAATSLITGTVNLVVIALPGGWELHPLKKPDIDAKVVYGRHAWATHGESSYHLLAPTAGGRWRVVGELEVEIRRRLGPVGRLFTQVAEAGEAEVNGHETHWALGWIQRGFLFIRRRSAALAVQLSCPHTRRSLRLVYFGADPGGLRPLLGHLQAIRCH